MVRDCELNVVRVVGGDESLKDLNGGDDFLDFFLESYLVGDHKGEDDYENE